MSFRYHLSTYTTQDEHLAFSPPIPSTPTLKVILPCAAAAAAKSLQSCPTLCDPIDGSPPGSPIPGILQARTLEWGAISFSNYRVLHHLKQLHCNLFRLKFRAESCNRLTIYDEFSISVVFTGVITYFLLYSFSWFSLYSFLIQPQTLLVTKSPL